ncbi:MAG: hypothetical protein E7290_00155 [Lachnospiraceae bacterium]|nr:hypothetical protein [Lachnospiraceae bacterium]
MNILVVYKSKTAFTKRYAEMIAEEVECTVMELKDVTPELISDYDIFVYGGGLYAGMINGLKQAKELFSKSRAKELVIFATGATPNEAGNAILDEMWKNNLTPEELESTAHFYMQSGLDYKNMKVPDKMIMKMMSFVLSKQKNKSEYDAGFEQAIRSSYDITSKEYAIPLIEYLTKLNICNPK